MQKIQQNFYSKDIISVNQFTKADIDILFAQADLWREKVQSGAPITVLSGKIMANLFYEPSTRTSSSFIAAMQRLGGGFIPINDVHYSSVSKGENLADTIRTLEQYSDVIVLRHPEQGQALLATKASGKPIINAGDGIGEHPTQALLDLYTIQNSFGSLEGLTVTMVGDLKNGRTVHSLAQLLALYDVKLNYVAPRVLQMPITLCNQLKNSGIQQDEHETLDAVIADSNVIYVTRIQKERFDSLSDYEAVKDAFVITPEIMQSAPKDSILMHPLPRLAEIHPSVDRDPRAIYFKQVQNGMYVRMALLSLLLREELS